MFSFLNVKFYQDFPEKINDITRDLNFFMNNLNSYYIQDFYIDILKDLNCTIIFKLRKTRLGNYSWKYMTKFSSELKSPNSDTIAQNILKDSFKEINKCYIKFIMNNKEYKIYNYNDHILTDCDCLPEIFFNIKNFSYVVKNK